MINSNRIKSAATPGILFRINLFVNEIHPFRRIDKQMLQLKPIRKTAALLFVFALLASAVFADTIRLKDGSIIKGKIISFAGDVFTVKIGDREMTFTSAEVESIQFDSPMVSAARTSGVDQPPIVIRSTPRTEPTPSYTETAETTSDPVDEPETPAETPKENIYAEDRGTTPVETTVPTISAETPDGRANRKPISLNVKVLADETSNGWTNSGWIVKKGQKIRITGAGEVSLGNGTTSPAAGLPDYEDPQKLMQSVPTGALIAVIGDDNNDFIYVGMERTFTAERDGALFLGVNDGNLNDNAGAFDVTIEIDPDSGI